MLFCRYASNLTVYPERRGSRGRLPLKRRNLWDGNPGVLCFIVCFDYSCFPFGVPIAVYHYVVLLINIDPGYHQFISFVPMEVASYLTVCCTARILGTIAWSRSHVIPTSGECSNISIIHDCYRFPWDGLQVMAASIFGAVGFTPTLVVAAIFSSHDTYDNQ